MKFVVSLLTSAATTSLLMKWLKKIGLGLASLILLLFIISLFLPSTWRVERSVIIAADTAAIYPYLANLKKWPEWTSWTKEKDPTLTFSFEGASEGTGAIQRWTSQKFGNGALRLKAADPRKGVWFDLQFHDGRFNALGMILFQRLDEGTMVVWIDEGNLGWNFPGRYFALFFDRWMGPDFTEGLDKLKRLVEAKKT